jgi:hypothetical protein
MVSPSFYIPKLCPSLSNPPLAHYPPSNKNKATVQALPGSFNPSLAGWLWVVSGHLLQQLKVELWLLIDKNTQIFLGYMLAAWNKVVTNICLGAVERRWAEQACCMH